MRVKEAREALAEALNEQVPTVATDDGLRVQLGDREVFLRAVNMSPPGGDDRTQPERRVLRDGPLRITRR